MLDVLDADFLEVIIGERQKDLQIDVLFFENGKIFWEAEFVEQLIQIPRPLLQHELLFGQHLTRQAAWIQRDESVHTEGHVRSGVWLLGFESTSLMHWWTGLMYWWTSLMHWCTSMMHWFTSMMHWCTSMMHWCPSLMHWCTSLMRWYTSLMHWWTGRGFHFCTLIFIRRPARSDSTCTCSGRTNRVLPLPREPILPFVIVCDKQSQSFHHNLQHFPCTTGWTMDNSDTYKWLLDQPPSGSCPGIWFLFELGVFNETQYHRHLFWKRQFLPC